MILAITLLMGKHAYSPSWHFTERENEWHSSHCVKSTGEQMNAYSFLQLQMYRKSQIRMKRPESVYLLILGTNEVNIN